MAGLLPVVQVDELTCAGATSDPVCCWSCSIDPSDTPNAALPYMESRPSLSTLEGLFSAVTPISQHTPYPLPVTTYGIPDLRAAELHPRKAYNTGWTQENRNEPMAGN